MRHPSALVVVVGAALSAGVLVAQAQPTPTIRALAVVGDPTPVGGTFARFEGQPASNETDAVAFVASVEGGSTTRAIFLASGARIAKVVAEGEPTPLGGTFDRFSLGWPAPTRSGAVLFLASIAGGRAPGGVFLASQGATTKVVAEGEPTPLGGTFGAIDDRPWIASDEAVAWTADVLSGGASRGIFVVSQGNIRKVVAVGDPTPLGGTFTGLESPGLAGRDALAFIGLVGGGSASQGLFLASGGRITSLLRTGEAAPDTGGARFLRFKDAGLDDQGQVPFRAFLQDPKVTTGFYLVNRGAVTKLAALGDVLEKERILETAIGRPVANRQGTVAFQVHLKRGRRGVPWHASYLYSRGTLVKVIAEGDPTPLGGTFVDASPPFLSDSGAVVFRAAVVGGRSSEGIFMAHP